MNPQYSEHELEKHWAEIQRIREYLQDECDVEAVVNYKHEFEAVGYICFYQDVTIRSTIVPLHDFDTRVENAVRNLIVRDVLAVIDEIKLAKEMG